MRLKRALKTVVKRSFLLERKKTDKLDMSPGLSFSLLLITILGIAHCANSFKLLYRANLIPNEQFLVEEDPSQAHYDPHLSYLSLVASAAAYASQAASNCYGNSGLTDIYGPIMNVSQVVVPASWHRIGGTWSGFVARLPNKRITMVVYRGTNEDSQLIAELLSVLKFPPVPSPIGGRVQAYFREAQLAVWSNLSSAFARLRSAHPGDTVLVTGHSLGGAMAALTAAELAVKGIKLQLYTFGEPRVGDAGFSEAFDKIMADSSGWRVVNGRDPVVHLPLCKGPLENCQPSERTSPYHHGTEVFYPSGMQPNSPDGFQICSGQPKDEDRQCANSPNVFLPCLTKMASCIDAHLHYYGIEVGNWWLNSQCRPTKKTDESIVEDLVINSLRVFTD